MNKQEKLKDAMSLLLLLESDLSQQHTDEIYLRTVRIIYAILNSIIKEE